MDLPFFTTFLAGFLAAFFLGATFLATFFTTFFLGAAFLATFLAAIRKVSHMFWRASTTLLFECECADMFLSKADQFKKRAPISKP